MGAFAYVYTHHLLKIGAEGSAGVVGVAHHFAAITATLRAEDVEQLVAQLQDYLREDGAGAGCRGGAAARRAAAADSGIWPWL